MIIYADNAATTRMSKAAIDAMLPYFDQVYANPSSLHSTGQRAAMGLHRSRETIAGALGCAAGEIYFTSGGSESDNQAILSAAEVGEKNGKKHIISSKIEHPAVLQTLEKLKKRGFQITLLDAHENGVVRPEELAAAMQPDTALVTIMYANHEIGSIQPIDRLGRICRERGVLFHTDAVQAVGHLPIDVETEQIDLLSFSAHKFHGPKGTGGLYARRGIVLTKLIEGGDQERGKRAGTENIPAIVGMAAALKEAVGRMEEDAAKLTLLRDRLIHSLMRIPGTVLNGDPALRLPGNVNLCFEGIESESLLLLLDREGIAASAGSACASGSLDPSHVLLAIGRSPVAARGSLRISLSRDNTPEEIEYLIKTIGEVVSYLRKASSPTKKERQEQPLC